MGNIQTKLGDVYKKEWIMQHKKHYKVKTRPFKTFADKNEIVNWVRDNTIGDSTAEFTRDVTLRMMWLFDTKSDAAMFKLVYGGE